MKSNFEIRCVAIIFIAAGYGWAGGHYIPSNSNLVAYLFQFIVLGIFTWLTLKFLAAAVKGLQRSWSIKGLTYFSLVSFLINILNVIHGAINKDPNSFGSHNTFADLVPIAFLIGGSGLWLATILPWKRTINS